jgi:hypothetical protein
MLSEEIKVSADIVMTRLAEFKLILPLPKSKLLDPMKVKFPKME